MARQGVVGIKEGDVLSGRVIETRVAGAGKPAVLLSEDADARIPPGIGREHFARLVGRAVVHADQLEVLLGLGQDRFDRGGNRRFGPVRWHDDGDLRHRVQLYHE